MTRRWSDVEREVLGEKKRHPSIQSHYCLATAPPWLALQAKWFDFKIPKSPIYSKVLLGQTKTCCYFHCSLHPPLHSCSCFLDVIESDSPRKLYYFEVVRVPKDTISLLTIFYTKVLLVSSLTYPKSIKDVFWANQIITTWIRFSLRFNAGLEKDFV